MSQSPLEYAARELAKRNGDDPDMLMNIGPPMYIDGQKGYACFPETSFKVWQHYANKIMEVVALLYDNGINTKVK